MTGWFRGVLAVVVVFGLWSAAFAEGDEPAKPETPAEKPVAKPTAAEEYKQLLDQLAGITSPADGLPLLEAFISSHQGVPQAEMAQKELAMWKDRADKNLVRFGQTWRPKDEVDKLNAKVEEMLTAAASEEKTDKAIKLLTDAAKINPYRTDIPFKKFQAFLKDKREKEAAGALAGVLKIDPNNVAAMNNIGVLDARQKQWQQAFDMLLRAAGKSPDTNAIWDNFDAATVMAEENGGASLVQAADSAMRGLVAKIHKAGKHPNETRWGNSWISEEDYAKYAKENRQSGSKLVGIKSRIRSLKASKSKLERERKVLADKDEKTSTDTAQIKQLDKKIEAIDKQLSELEDQAEKSKGNEPSHADKLVLLALDGSELESLEAVPADAKDEPKDGEKGKEKEK